MAKIKKWIKEQKFLPPGLVQLKNQITSIQITRKLDAKAIIDDLFAKGILQNDETPKNTKSSFSWSSFSDKIVYNHSAMPDFKYSPSVSSWEKMSLHPKVLERLEQQGYSQLTPIQAIACPAMLMEQDVAYSGTNGKTIAYIIYTISKALELKAPQKTSPAAVVVLPSRELAQYVHELYCSFLPSGLTYYSCIGGTSLRAGMNVAKAADIVIGTAGRILDMINRSTLKVSATSILVLDEVNTLLTKKDALYDIFQKLPASVQVIATAPSFRPDTLSTFTHFIKTKPISDGLSPTNISSIRNYEVELKEEEKLESLVDILSRNSVKTIIFSNTRRKVDWLCESLKNANINSVSGLHGDISQETRQSILADFKEKDTWILITCGSMLQGLKFNGIRLVILYDDMPMEDSIRAAGLLPGEGKGSILYLRSPFQAGKNSNGVQGIAIPLPADISGIF